jgi:type IV pilus assembly protein PilW
MKNPRALSTRTPRGLTLVELMVALLGGMLLTLAAFSVLSSFEGRKRTLNASNDIEQAGQVALFRIDSWIRSAGASLPLAAQYAYGCPLYATKSGTQLLPRSDSLDAPFAKVNPGKSGVFRLAPVMILPGQTTPGVSGQASDVLVVMSAVPRSGTSTAFSSASDGSVLTLQNTVDFAGGDLILVADQQEAEDGSVRPCMVEQVASSFTGGSAATMTLGGSYYAAAIGTASLTGYTDSGFALRLGDTSSARPAFMLLGVGDNDVLYSYDLLNTPSASLQAEADAVFELHALYGVDTDGDGKVDSWVSPSTGDYSVASLSAGNAAASQSLRRIKAIRVGLIMRSPLPEKTEVMTTSPTLFADLGDNVKYVRSLSSAEKHYRYRAIETTVPLRNNLLVQ